jgi:hypothetical protein
MTKDLTDALRQASGQGCAAPPSTTYVPRALPNVPELPPLPPRSGTATAQLPASTESGGGFEESNYLLRQCWDDLPLMTADGLFTLVIRPIKQIALVGGTAALFKEPVTETP